MTTGQIENQFHEAVIKSDYDLITSLFATLNNSPEKFDEHGVELYKKMGDLVFVKLNFIPPNYFFEQFKKKVSSNFKKPDIKENSQKLKSQKRSFDSEFVSFFNRHREALFTLKDFYIFHFENYNSDDDIRFQILCCDISLNNPILKKICSSETLLNANREGVINYIDNFKPGQYPEGEFICLLSLTPTLNDFQGIESYLKKLGDLFETAEQILVKQNEVDISTNDYKIQSMDKAIEHIKQCSTKVFNNVDMTFGEEDLIKKFFSNSETIINYKIIKPGQSGSRVIEVQSVSHLYSPQKRFVIKIAKKEGIGQEKLKSEHEKFKKHIKNAATTETSYSADYDFNDNYEAIQYNYASTGSLKDAIAFSKLITDYLDVTKKINYPISEIVNKLLESELFLKAWNTTSPTEKECFELYEPYLKNENKILIALAEINDSNTDISFVIDFYNKIKSLKLDTKIKICHGDLHTDNFFWDEKNVTLIDFGFTDPHHSTVDHTFLEMSIKMKHFPRYIPTDEIIEYEKRFLTPESFNKDFDLTFIKRDNLRELYRLIHRIRLDSKKYVKLSSNHTEYLISLFLINFRQIQFWDLNQLLGLKCVELYGKELSKILNLEK